MRLYELFNQEQTGGTFVSAKFGPKTVQRLENWCAEHNIPNALPKDKFHVSLVMSKDKVIPDFPVKTYSPLLRIEPNYTFKLFGENQNVLVLALDSPELVERHMWARSKYYLGWEFNSFVPHITLSYDVGENFDITALPLPSFPLFVDHEHSEPYRKPDAVKEALVEDIAPGENRNIDEMGFQAVWSLIEAQCGKSLSAMRQTGKLLYRGLGASKGGMFKGSPRIDRKPLHSKTYTHNFAIKGFELNGFVANRQNSIAVTSNLDFAMTYASSENEVYCIFPQDNCSFTYSHDVEDFITFVDQSWNTFYGWVWSRYPELLLALMKTSGLADEVQEIESNMDEYIHAPPVVVSKFFVSVGGRQQITSRSEFTPVIKEFWAKRIEEYGMAHDDSWASALTSGSEVMISGGSYYAINLGNHTLYQAMKSQLSEAVMEDGKIVPNVNTTIDIGPNEIQTQAAKFGNITTDSGHPVLNMRDAHIKLFGKPKL